MKKMRRLNCEKLVAIMICTSLLLTMSMAINEARGQNEATILIDPNLVQANPGDNFTITINATNVASMGIWQIVLKYNLTVMNVTSMWIPTENVFGDPTVYQQQTVQPDYGVDFVDHLGYVGFGNALFSGEVPVSNGILCKANCTVLGDGQTTILIATRANPAFKSVSQSDAFASFLGTWSDQYQQYVDVPQPLRTKSTVMTSGAALSKPIAVLSATATLADNTKYIVIDGHQPPGDTAFLQAYKTYPVTFNASGSYGMMVLENGTKVISSAAIGKYHWDFGDGTNATTDDPIIVHTYDAVGQCIASIWVEDKGIPPSDSETVEMNLVVGLVLDYFSWTPLVYAVIAIAVAAAAYYAFRQTRRYQRERRELRARRLASKRLHPTSQ
jgi:PKD repeat protein